MEEKVPILFKDQFGFRKDISILSAHSDFLEKAR
jgi:hypothetical protein